MKLVKIVGLVLIVLGLVVLVQRGFSYTKEHNLRLGPVKVAVRDKERVEIPAWAGVVSVVAGAGLLLVRSRR